MNEPRSEHPQEVLLYWLLGPRLRHLIARMDATLKTRRALGRVVVVTVALVAITLVMVGFGLDDAYGPVPAVLFFLALVLAFRLAPFPLPKAPPVLDGREG